MKEKTGIASFIINITTTTEKVLRVNKQNSNRKTYFKSGETCRRWKTRKAVDAVHREDKNGIREGKRRGDEVKEVKTNHQTVSKLSVH